MLKTVDVKFLNKINVWHVMVVTYFKFCNTALSLINGIHVGAKTHSFSFFTMHWKEFIDLQYRCVTAAVQMKCQFGSVKLARDTEALKLHIFTERSWSSRAKKIYFFLATCRAFPHACSLFLPIYVAPWHSYVVNVCCLCVCMILL